MTEHGSFGGKSADPQPLPSDFAPFAEGGGTPSPTAKPNSGYARQKLRHNRLIADHKALQERHRQLTSDHEERLAAFDELKSLNDELAADLKRARQRPSVPFSSALMGVRYGG